MITSLLKSIRRSSRNTHRMVLEKYTKVLKNKILQLLTVRLSNYLYTSYYRDIIKNVKGFHGNF